MRRRNAKESQLLLEAETPDKLSRDTAIDCHLYSTPLSCKDIFEAFHFLLCSHGLQSKSDPNSLVYRDCLCAASPGAPPLAFLLILNLDCPHPLRSYPRSNVLIRLKGLWVRCRGHPGLRLPQ